MDASYDCASLFICCTASSRSPASFECAVMPIFCASGSLRASRDASRLSYAPWSYAGMFALTSTIVCAALTIHSPPVLLYSPSRSVELPSRFTQFWKASAAWPSQFSTLWFFRSLPIFVISISASFSSWPRVLTFSPSTEASIASSSLCE
ncbi:hypothetical protein DEJ50_12270 [Streptomyces venezuelae]|uniref:Uncharacterized protein n=1 Tax=Streptomyces venezuelae TaxID=54571 RepID=A0A5P2D364_STRVZ|nr:hypothetical protein DEJ50_12270 [Streptomyces venezuelae]